MSYREQAVSTMHWALENGADLHVNERHKMRHYRGTSTEERRRRKKNGKLRFFLTSRGVYVNLRYIEMLLLHRYYTQYLWLYTHSIENQP